MPEVQLFSYLACLLWLYERRSVADWGYSFAATDLGAPYSPELDSSIALLVNQRCLETSGGRIELTETGKGYLDALSALDLNKDRMGCLMAACASTAAFSPGMINAALSNIPELRRARHVPMTRALLEEHAVFQLYTDFGVIRGALGAETVDLRLPAVIWLSALEGFRQQGVQG